MSTESWSYSTKAKILVQAWFEFYLSAVNEIIYSTSSTCFMFSYGWKDEIIWKSSYCRLSKYDKACPLNNVVKSHLICSWTVGYMVNCDSKFSQAKTGAIKNINIIIIIL